MDLSNVSTKDLILEILSRKHSRLVATVERNNMLDLNEVHDCIVGYPSVLVTTEVTDDLIKTFKDIALEERLSSRRGR